MYPVIMQEFTPTLLGPRPLQQPTKPLQIWRRPLCVAGLRIPGLLDFYNLGLGLECPRARLPNNNFYPVCEGLKMGSA